MAKRYKKTGVVGGFDTLRAAQRAAGSPSSDAGESAPSGEKDRSGPAGPRKIASRIDHTALPTKHEIRCYECGFEFQLTGRSPTTNCPKCRKLLQIKEYTISDSWSEDVKTAGRIEVQSGAVLQEGELVATDIVLDGQMAGAQLQAYRWLEIGKHAKIEEQAIDARDLRVGAEAHVVLKRKAVYHNVEVHGHLKAKLHASGRVRVKAGGFLEGEVHGQHLEVEEGGGLKAKVRVEEAEPEAAPADQATLPLEQSA